MTVINKPGFYTSKAGKCEVVAVSQGFAFGFILGSDHPSWRARIWYADDGHSTEWTNSRITGPWIEPHKPVEEWRVSICGSLQPYHYMTRKEAEAALKSYQMEFPAARLIHLVEAP